MDQLLEYLSLYRLLTFTGRLGFGKTAFSVIIAKRLLEAGLVDGAVTNFPTILPAHIRQDDGLMYNRVQIRDEAWLNYDARSSMTNNLMTVAAFLRKWGCYGLFPSVHAVDRRLRPIVVKPLFRTPWGNTTTWECRVTNDDDPLVFRVKVDISEAFGLYSTSYIPTNDCGMDARFNHTYFMDTGRVFNARQATARRDKEIAALAALSTSKD